MSIEGEAKPPLGVPPRTEWLAARVQALEEAVIRYLNTGHPIPPEWVTERNSLLRPLDYSVHNPTVITGKP